MKFIVAMESQTYAIGYQGDMAWGNVVKEDLAFFKTMTMNKTVVMGSKTYQGMIEKNIVLKNRNILVLSNKKTGAPYCTLKNLETMLIKQEFGKNNDNLFVIGGKQIYELMLQSNVLKNNLTGGYVSLIQFNNQEKPHIYDTDIKEFYENLFNHLNLVSEKQIADNSSYKVIVQEFSKLEFM